MVVWIQKWNNPDPFLDTDHYIRSGIYQDEFFEHKCGRFLKEIKIIITTLFQTSKAFKKSLLFI